MALTLRDQDGVFVAAGSINKATSESFQLHLNTIFDQYKSVTINIDEVNQIDANGLSVLKEFYLIGLRYNRNFFIIGNGCKEIYDEFKFDAAVL